MKESFNPKTTTDLFANNGLVMYTLVILKVHLGYLSLWHFLRIINVKETFHHLK
jgi:hypothetical protein